MIYLVVEIRKVARYIYNLVLIWLHNSSAASNTALTGEREIGFTFITYYYIHSLITHACQCIPVTTAFINDNKSSIY
jgi:hypothetical protein